MLKKGKKIDCSIEIFKIHISVYLDVKRRGLGTYRLWI